MILKFEIVEATAVEDGDIFYCTPSPELNEFGSYYKLSGTDQIFIRDDEHGYDENDNYGIAVNGGYVIWFAPKVKVVKLAHYSDLIRVIEMVKIGNPEMVVGPNDFPTILSKFIEEYPDEARDLFDSFEFDPD